MNLRGRHFEKAAFMPVPQQSLFVPRQSIFQLLSFIKVASKCQIPYANFAKEVLTVYKLTMIKIIVNRVDWL